MKPRRDAPQPLPTSDSDHERDRRGPSCLPAETIIDRSCLPARTTNDEDEVDIPVKTGSSGAACRRDSKLLASEDKHELDFKKWAGQQRVSSLLAVDGFRSQQRARPTSIRPYIAPQHLRPIPPTRRPDSPIHGFRSQQTTRPTSIRPYIARFRYHARPISIRPYTNGFRSQQLQAARGNSIRPYINALARLPSSGFRSQQLGIARARRTARVQTS